MAYSRSLLLLIFRFFFVYAPAYLDVQLAPDEEFRIYYFGPSKFGSSEIGKIVSYVIYFVRDVLTLALEMGINISSIVLLRRLIKNKKDMGLKSKQPTTSIELEDIANTCRGLRESKSDILTRANKNLTIMVSIMCLFSAMSHLTFIYCTVNFFFAQDLNAYIICDCSNFIILLKHLSNFCIFLLFNRLFRNEVRKIFFN